MRILERFSLSGKTAIVTGAGRGIGRSFALALAEAGADVALVDLESQGLESVAEAVEGLGQKSLLFRIDVTNLEAVNAMVRQVVEAWGKLDVGVNNAGIANTSPAEEILEEDWDAIMNVNLKGVFFCSQAEAKVMLPRGGGSIINTASMSATIANRPQIHAHYNASKAGVVQLSKSCAAEWANRGVRVNCISPGHTISPMTEKIMRSMSETWISNTPMGRLAEPADLQGAVVFLASDASRYVTGLNLVVDGGYTLW